MPMPFDSMLVDAAKLGTVLDNGEPASFVSGWTPSVAYLGFWPLVVLCFRHEDGGVASWFLDENLERRGGSVAELSPEARQELQEATALLFDGLWEKIMESPVPAPLDQREAAFFRIPEGTRREILDLYLDAFDAGTRFAAVDQIDPARPGSQLVDLGTRRLPMRRAHLHTLFDPGGLQRQNDSFIDTGTMSFPSPVDGSPMTVRHALVLHGTLYAYRAVEEKTGTVMFLVAGEIFFRLSGVFVPRGRLCVALHVDPIRAQMPEMYREFLARIMQHGDLLARYFANQRTVPLHAWRGVTAMHIGHVLWNDLSGINTIVRRAKPNNLPRFMLCDAELEPEMYGRLDEIFPELRGLVDRNPKGFQDSIPSFYSNGQCLIRSSSMTVHKDMRTRILHTVRPMDRASPASLCALARADDVPVVMFGIRVENRTMVNLEQFCVALVDQIGRTFRNAVLVVDGHNSRIGQQDSFIWSHGEHGAKRRPIEIERDMVAAMQERAQGTGVEIISTIGFPITESLACGREATQLVAVWGAGLAKYRWVCNIPGLIITNGWNLANLGDLHLYDSPHTMEEPSPVRFIAPDAVEDLPEAELVVPLGPDFIPSICNFRIDIAKAMRTVDDTLRMSVPITI